MMLTAERIAEISKLVAETGLTLEWDADHEVFLFQLHDTEPATIDQWWQVVQTLSAEMDDDQPFNSVYELEGGDGLITTYARQAITMISEQVVAALPNLHGRLAVVVPPTSTARFLRVFIQSLAYRVTAKLEVQIFNNRTAALDWASN